MKAKAMKKLDGIAQGVSAQADVAGAVLEIVSDLEKRLKAAEATIARAKTVLSGRGMPID